MADTTKIFDVALLTHFTSALYLYVSRVIYDSPQMSLNAEIVTSTIGSTH